MVDCRLAGYQVAVSAAHCHSICAVFHSRWRSHHGDYSTTDAFHSEHVEQYNMPWQHHQMQESYTSVDYSVLKKLQQLNSDDCHRQTLTAGQLNEVLTGAKSPQHSNDSLA